MGSSLAMPRENFCVLRVSCKHSGTLAVGFEMFVMISKRLASKVLSWEVEGVGVSYLQKKSSRLQMRIFLLNRLRYA